MTITNFFFIYFYEQNFYNTTKWMNDLAVDISTLNWKINVTTWLIAVEKITERSKPFVAWGIENFSFNIWKASVFGISKEQFFPIYLRNKLLHNYPLNYSKDLSTLQESDRSAFVKLIEHIDQTLYISCWFLVISSEKLTRIEIHFEKESIEWNRFDQDVFRWTMHYADKHRIDINDA